MGVFERFTDRARRVLVLAQEEARMFNHSFIGTEHLLLGLIHEGDGLAAKALESLGITLEAVREKVEETIGMAGSDPSGSPPFTPRAKKVLEFSLREAKQLGHSYIGTEHILLGLTRNGEKGGDEAAQVLIGLGVDLDRVRAQVIQLMSGYSHPVKPLLEPGTTFGLCSFCNRQSSETGRLIPGDGAYICEHCIRLWAQRVAHRHFVRLCSFCGREQASDERFPSGTASICPSCLLRCEHTLAAQSASAEIADETPRCGFCSPVNEGNLFVAGPGVFICDLCVGRCRVLLDRTAAERAPRQAGTKDVPLRIVRSGSSPGSGPAAS
jgi:hypothetical protein